MLFNRRIKLKLYCVLFFFFSFLFKTSNAFLTKKSDVLSVDMHLSSPEKNEIEDQQTERSNRLIQEYYKMAPSLVTIDSLSNSGLPWKRKVSAQKKLPDPKPMSEEELAAISAKQAQEFQKKKYALLTDNLFLCSLGFAFCWGFFPIATSLSYALGAVVGLLYLALLARFVENLGQGGIGSGGGASRLALVVLLVLLCGKNREQLELPSALAGFFTYQVTTVLKGLNEDESMSD